MGADLFRADGRMQRRTDGRADMMKQIVAFRNFENAPKNCWDPNIRVCTITLKIFNYFYIIPPPEYLVTHNTAR